MTPRLGCATLKARLDARSSFRASVSQLMRLNECHKLGAMRPGQSRLWRRVGGVLALCGVLLYAALVPGHIVSQTLQQLVQTELGGVEIDCHEESGTQSNLPAKPKKSCPFCTGFAAF